jgi:flagellar basal body-associated protein FliL
MKKYISFFGLTLLSTMYAVAQTESAAAQGAAVKIQAVVVGLAYSVVGLVAIYKIVTSAITYMAKDKDQRSESDAKELKDSLFRVIVGAALVFGAVALGNWMISALR